MAEFPAENGNAYLVRKLFDLNNSLLSQNRSLAEDQRRLLADHSALKAKLEELDRKVSSETVRGRYIEDIPGKRVPYIYSVDITLAASTTTRTQGTITISQDGPFVADQIASSWRINATASAFNARHLPISSSDPGWAGTPQTAAGVVAGNIFDELLDFEWEVFDAGSDRAWQNIPASSPMLFSKRENPLHLPVSGFFERNSVISVFITPTRANTRAGILKFSFIGYKIVLPIDYRP